MTSLSIKWRISLWISAVLLAVIATISVAAYNEFEESHLRNLNRTLDAMANGILSSLDTSSNKEKWAAEVSKVTGQTGSNPPVLYRIWLDGSSEDLLAGDAPDPRFCLSTEKRGGWLHNLPEQNKPAVEKNNFMNIGLPGNEYRANWLRHKINGDIVNIVVAGSSHYTYHEMSEFLTLLLILGASLIIGSIIATMWTVRCNLRPIAQTAEQLQKINQPNLGGITFDAQRVPKELRPFVEALNALLGRLDRVLSRQRQFTSDAAHELRTPLSLAKSTLQAAQITLQRSGAGSQGSGVSGQEGQVSRDEGRGTRDESSIFHLPSSIGREPDEYRQAINDSLDALARMEHLIEQLLLLARLDESGRIRSQEDVRLDVLLRELAETYGEKMSHSAGKVIFEESPEIIIQGDLDELIRLFSNILDNACKYGPAGGTIKITLASEPAGYVTVSIHDQGGSIPPDALPHLFDRFYRADPSRSKSTGGAGLGLAIARQIARHHNGDISITSSPTGGTLVSIRLAGVPVQPEA